MTRHELKTRIKELAAEGSALRQKIQATRGPERHALWNEKRRVGRCARVALLAYAFIRGVPRERMELRCRPQGLLHPGVLAHRWEEELGIRLARPMYAAPTLPVSSRGLLSFFRRRSPALSPVSEPPVIDSVWTEARLNAWLTRSRVDAVAG